ncbi:peptidoglycan recognition family protein [Marinicella sp. W31]|uniref:peptidoglycan recognition protein family protein n=1 Tax=Marinicella sp. W31 TaxID=3023713 RepID=UPI003756E049
MKRRNFLISTGLMAVATVSTASYWKHRWKYIVVHHSGGEYGTIPFLQKVHAERQPNDPIDAIPYHYVIGNGNGIPMGEIKNDFRKKYNLWGSHLSANNSYRNFLSLGICLIGNFENKKVPSKQYEALLSLVRKLIRDYTIHVENVSGHGLIRGESTLCPGRHFPMQQLLKDIATSPSAHS